jgi:hypothetical protein
MDAALNIEEARRRITNRDEDGAARLLDETLADCRDPGRLAAIRTLALETRDGGGDADRWTEIARRAEELGGTGGPPPRH